MRLSHAVERHRTVIILATVLLTVAGLWALRALPSGIYPETAYPRIVVLARSATFDPPQMTIAVTRPLEEALLGLPGLRLVRSRTVHGSTEISLDFRPDADMMVALSQVQSRLAAVRGELPADAEVQAERLTPSVFPILQYSLTGGDPLALRDLALRHIRPRLSAVHDVADIEVQGGDARQITALLDPAKLSAERVSVEEVAEALRHGNSAATVGISQSAYRQYSLVVTSRASTAEQVGDVVVRQAGMRAVRVRDLGEVRVIAADRFDITTGDGKPAVLLNVMRQPNGNTVHIADGIDAAVRELRGHLPPGVDNARE